MCLECDGFSNDEIQLQIANAIRLYGCAVQFIENSDPAKTFGYTIGLTEHGHPEFLVRGLDMETTGEVLNVLARLVIETNESFGHKHTANYIGNQLLYFMALPDAKKHALVAFSNYGEAMNALEIFFISSWPPPPALLAEADRRGSESNSSDTPWWGRASSN